ncbi:MAG: DegQ family serine endoprotease [Proteobacteria bacterium]|nr:MAG: DegQ family serine endoprotease [Pseudomonadota bacterium]QKK11104.1 MAG: DegQ family serine endoprotease [Pseudomonadota bacterium]
MKRLAALTLSALLVIGPGAAHAALPFAVNGEELPSLAPMLEKVTPAVVNIATRSRVIVEDNPLLQDPFFRRFFDLPPNQPRERRTRSAGSGVIIDARRGYLLTNHHVIAKAEEIAVTLRDGRAFDAKLVGSDPEADVAVIQIEAENLTAVALADSDQLQVGDFVVAIGNPFGLGQTVTSGIVSALGRTGLGIEGYEDFIQTDASINPGNSGGALVNLRGELVGINTAIIGPAGGNVGIGFAIPSNMAREITEQLVEHGEVRRGLLGVGVQDLTPELARAFDIKQHRGAVVANIVEGSAADKAGLKTGDIILTVGGRKVRSASDLRNAVGLVRIGEKLEMGILREGRRMTLTAVIAPPKVDKVEGERIHPRLTGATLGSVTGADPEGVSILEVVRGSAAQQAGLRKGDLILSANRRPVSDLDDLRRVVAPDQPLLMNLQRGNSGFFVLLQ